MGPFRANSITLDAEAEQCDVWQVGFVEYFTYNKWEVC